MPRRECSPMRPILAPSNLRRASLLCMGIAFGLLVSPHAHDSTAVMIVSSALAFASVALLSRYGLPS